MTMLVANLRCFQAGAAQQILPSCGVKAIGQGKYRKFLEIVTEEFVAASKIEVAVSKELKERLLLEGFDKRYGAREGHCFASLVEDKLAEEILMDSAGSARHYYNGCH